jgi:hypothetical protein
MADRTRVAARDGESRLATTTEERVAFAVDSVSTTDIRNVVARRVALAAEIDAAVAAERPGPEGAVVSDGTYALVLADVAAAHLLWGYGEYRAAAADLGQLVVRRRGEVSDG